MPYNCLASLSLSLLFLSTLLFFLLPLPPSLAKRCVRTAVPSLLQTVTHTEFQPGGNLIQKIIPTADENMGTKEEEEKKNNRKRENAAGAGAELNTGLFPPPPPLLVLQL